MLRFMGPQRVRHNRVTELNRTNTTLEINYTSIKYFKKKERERGRYLDYFGEKNRREKRHTEKKSGNSIQISTLSGISTTVVANGFVL